MRLLSVRTARLAVGGLAGGVVLSACSQTGLVPATATDQELATYHYPRRPKDARGAAAWQRHVRPADVGTAGSVLRRA